VTENSVILSNVILSNVILSNVILSLSKDVEECRRECHPEQCLAELDEALSKDVEENVILSLSKDVEGNVILSLTKDA